jgi:CubicO group peptidase (beta-lactamase class C family)
VSGLYAEVAEDLAASLREILDSGGLAGLTAAAAVDGEVVFSSGFGYADLESRVPVTPETRMRVGSVSKAITSIALAVLYERGKLDLDAPVQTYLPEFPQKRYPISTRQVAGHIAGIRHYRDAEFLSSQHYDDVVDALEIFENDPLLFEPGTDYSYSSYGWNLISAVVQRAADEPFLEFMRREVFDSFGMESTIADQNRSIIADRTRFYVRLEGGAVANADFVDNSIKWAGGGFLSTPEDLLRFGQGVMDDTVLEADTRELLWASLETSDGTATGYGLGWNVLVFDPSRASDMLQSMATEEEIEAMRGRFFARHGGGSMGGITAFLLLPEAKVAVAIVSNTSDVPDLGGRLMNVAMLTAHRLATTISAD